MAVKTPAAKVAFEISVEVDKTSGRLLAAYLKVRPGKSAFVREYAGGAAIADYDKKGHLIGLELLAPCEVAVLDRISRKEPKPVKNFLRNSIPREMTLA